MSERLKTWSFPLTVDQSFTLTAEISTILELPVLENRLINPSLPRSVAEVQLFLRPPISSLEEVCNTTTGHVYTIVALFDGQGESLVLRAVIDRVVSVLSTYLMSRKDEYLSVEELLSILQRESDTPSTILKENMESILMTHLPQLAHARLRLNVLLEMRHLMEAMASLTAASITFLQGLAEHMTNTIDSDEFSLDTHAINEVEQAHEELGHVVDRYRESGLLYTRCGIEKICESRTSLELLSSQILLGKSLEAKEGHDMNKLS